MESRSLRQSSDSLSAYQTPPSSLGREPDTPASQYGSWQVENIEEPLSQLPTQRDDGSPDDFASIYEMQVEPQEPQQGWLSWAWSGLANRFWKGSQVSKPEESAVAQVALAQSTSGTEPKKEGLITRLITRYAPRLLPIWNYDKTLKSSAAVLLRGVLKDKVGVDFDLKDEVWQQILEDILVRVAGEVAQERATGDQDILIPKITIQTSVGDVVIKDIRLTAHLQDFNNDCPLLGHQKHHLSVHVDRLNCSVEIPIQGRESVELRISAHNGEINLGTDMLDMVINPKPKVINGLLDEGLGSPLTPRDNTAVQFRAESVEVQYTKGRAMFGMDGSLLASHNDDDTLMAGFDGGKATFSNITLSRQLNCLKTNPDQASQVQIGGMTVTNDPPRKAVINLDSISVNDLDDYHNGTLSCEVTLKPRHLQRSPSMRWKLLGHLFDGITTLKVRVPIRDGEIKLNRIKTTREKWEELSPDDAKSMGYIEVNSSNPIIQTVLGRLLRSRFTKIVHSSSGPKMQLGLPYLRVEMQLPGFVPHTDAPDDDGNIILTELLDQIGGDLLRFWMLVPAKLMLTQKHIETQCFAASQGSIEAASSLLQKYVELKHRGHFDEALRVCLAIPTATYKTLIAESEAPIRRHTFYEMAHELTEVDPPKAVAVYAALLAKHEYLEDPKTSNPAWLITLAKDIDANGSGTDETITDILAFAYKSDPFAGADGLKELCRLTTEGRFPKEQLTQLVLDNIRLGKFNKNPKALAATVIALEEFVGSDIMRILHEYPSKELGQQVMIEGQREFEARQLVDRLVFLMEKYQMAVNAAGLYLHINEPVNAKSILEGAIRSGDVMALRERITREVDEGLIGHPRYTQAAELLKRILTAPDLSPDMREMGQKMLECLWNKTYDNIEVARVFCPDVGSRDPQTPYARAVTSLFGFMAYETADSEHVIQRIGGIRTLLLQARDDENTTARERIMINCFSSLLNDLQLQHEPLRPTATIWQTATALVGSGQSSGLAGLVETQQQYGHTVQLVYPARPRVGLQTIPEWLTEQDPGQETLPLHE